MKFGLYLPNFGPLASAEWIPALAQHAEGLGFDSIWAADNIVYHLSMLNDSVPNFTKR